MQHWPSAEPAISSASQDNPGNSWNQQVHHRVQNSRPIMPILSQVNHGQKLRYYFWKINFNIILPSARRSFRWAPSFRFPKQKALCISLLLVCATHIPPLFFLHFINTNIVTRWEVLASSVDTARVSFLLQNIMIAYGAQKSSCTMSNGGPSWVKAAGAWI